MESPSLVAGDRRHLIGGSDGFPAHVGESIVSQGKQHLEDTAAWLVRKKGGHPDR